MIEWYRVTILGSGRSAALWLLLGFIVTFAVTRWVTVTIRNRTTRGGTAGRSPIKDLHIGGVHVHHQVWGIFLVLITGLLEFRYQPAAPWRDILAVLFGAGAALALDEFALWLHLEDVYWSAEGRRSIDAVLVATVVGLALLAGTSPVGVAGDDARANGPWVTAVVVVVHIAVTVVCLLKGKLVLGLVGLPLPGLSMIGVCRLARPSSFWARRFYRGPKLERARRREARVVARRERVRDLLSGNRTSTP